MSVEWLIIRGSGVVAFALLSAATIWGLLVSTKLLGRLVKAKPLTWFHESLGIGALLATLVHVGVLSVHDFLDFSWAEIIVPGLSDWRPLAITTGIGALYGLLLVSTSFYFKRWMGQDGLANNPFRLIRRIRYLAAARGVGRNRRLEPADDRPVSGIGHRRLLAGCTAHRRRNVENESSSEGAGGCGMTNLL